MHVIRSINVNDAWVQAINLMTRFGEVRPTRNGTARVLNEPVTTVYENPRQRVLFDPVRNANPIFHLHESLWMLAGRSDATWLDQFIGDFSARYGEEGGDQHGAYGKRWRRWFQSAEWPSDGVPEYIDQLDVVVRLLRENPYDRQVVLTMWDPTADLGVPDLKDRPCNQQVLFRADRSYLGTHLLDMTVTCRSNDMVWGAYGANAVHFSVLQEYVAARTGHAVGRYYHVSNNLHLYENTANRADIQSAVRTLTNVLYPADHTPMFLVPECADDDIAEYVENPHRGCRSRGTPFLTTTAYPMYMVNECRKAKKWDEALSWALRIEALDWRIATLGWLTRLKSNPLGTADPVSTATEDK